MSHVTYEAVMLHTDDCVMPHANDIYTRMLYIVAPRATADCHTYVKVMSHICKGHVTLTGIRHVTFEQVMSHTHELVMPHTNDI